MRPEDRRLLNVFSIKEQSRKPFVSSKTVNESEKDILKARRFSSSSTLVAPVLDKVPGLTRSPSTRRRPNPKRSSKVKPVLVIHGGAGTMTREGSTPERREAYRAALKKALMKGHEVLQAGGEAMDAAVAAVGMMEDCPLFNSGRGAVFNAAGKNELEASIMLSKPPNSHPEIPENRRGLSLTLLSRTRNPASAVRHLYLSPQTVPHPFLSGAPAEKVLQGLGEELVNPSYFFTEARWREHRRGLGLPEEPLPYPPKSDENAEIILDDTMPKGTVGAVALDVNGCIATVTSTGGRTNKMEGRIGDTPHMGAGFWAEEWTINGLVKRTWRKITRKSTRRAVGVSGTGDGDYFIRYNAAASIAHRMKYLGESLATASRFVVKDLGENDGLGGIISVDDQGNYSLPMNSPGMYRGVVTSDSVAKVAIFADEELE